MSNPGFHCFVEDDAHESFMRAFLPALWTREGRTGTSPIQFLTNRGGTPKLFGSLRDTLRRIKRGASPISPLIVLIDANCHGPNDRRREVLKLAEKEAHGPHNMIVGTPDPHIERWLADPAAIAKAFDGKVSTALPVKKCARDYYKRLLADMFSGFEFVPLSGGVEFADRIVPGIDFDNPSSGDHQLTEFANSLRAHIRSLSGGESA